MNEVILPKDQIKLCAQAMGISVITHGFGSEHGWFEDPGEWGKCNEYNPLKYPAQAFLLQERFGLSISKLGESPYVVWPNGLYQDGNGHSQDLKAAIVECVARLERTRQKRRADELARKAVA